VNAIAAAMIKAKIKTLSPQLLNSRQSGSQVAVLGFVI
jgi:hypothetical protein